MFYSHVQITAEKEGEYKALAENGKLLAGEKKTTPAVVQIEGK